MKQSTPAFVSNQPITPGSIKANLNPVLSEIKTLNGLRGEVVNLNQDIKSKNALALPQDIKTTRDLTTRYLEQKMPSTDSWLYKNTGFLDKPGVQKVVKADQKILDEVGKAAPTATGVNKLAHDMKSYDFSKVPGDIKQTQSAMTDYLAQKMSSPNSMLYKATNVLDTPAGRAAVKGSQQVLDAAAPVASGAGLARDIWTGKAGSISNDVKQTQNLTTDYLAKKMPSTDSWLYKNTNWLDKPAGQAVLKGAQNVVDAAPTAVTAGILAKDVATLRVDKLAGDIKATQSAMTDYFAKKLPADNWAYRALDTKAGQVALKASEGLLNATTKVSEFAGRAKEVAGKANDVMHTIEKWEKWL